MKNYRHHPDEKNPLLVRAAIALMAFITIAVWAFYWEAETTW